MFVIQSHLLNGQGDEIESTLVSGHTADAAYRAAEAWAIGALRRADDPDAYVEHHIERA